MGVLNTAYLLLGSNEGERETILSLTRHSISSSVGQIVASSSIYESEPWGFEDERNFLNQVIKIKTELAPMDLLTMIHEVEESIGRKRSTGEGYESRIIDIDILFYNEYILNLEGLVIPHPRIRERRFVLAPMNEIDSSMIHPVHNKPLKELLFECDDKLHVDLFEYYAS